MESSSPNRNYDLVTCVTPDTVKLHGLFQRANPDLPKNSSLDAAIVLHGLGGNFYSSTLNLRLADALVQLGISVVLGNTRGHDGVSMSPVNGRAQTIGAAYEVVDDCRNDLTGWTNWLAEKRGFHSIALVGHSLGAIKSLYCQAHQPHDSVDALIGLSATRLCYEKLLESNRAEDFQKWLRQAKEWIEQGREHELMRVDFPFPTHMAAGAYQDKYGPANRYDWVSFADKIYIPALLLFGERELTDNAAFHGLIEEVDSVVARKENFHVGTIKSANHFYAGVHDRATAAIKRWIVEQFPIHGDSRSIQDG